MPQTRCLTWSALLVFLSVLLFSGPVWSQNPLVEKLQAAGKTLRVVKALNDASQYEARVSAGEFCMIYSGSALRKMADLGDGLAEVLYRPTLVFLSTGENDRGRLLNVWSDFLIPGRPEGFCPHGTRFAAAADELRQWGESREQLVLYPRPAAGRPAGVTRVAPFAAN